MRISLAWFADPVVDPTPLLTADRTTVVVMWCTDSGGRILADQLHAAQVKRWSVGGAVLDQLRLVHAEWPLRSHDLLFGGEPVGVRPCAHSLLRAVEVRQPALARRLASDRDLHIAAVTDLQAREPKSA